MGCFGWTIIFVVLCALSGFSWKQMERCDSKINNGFFYGLKNWVMFRRICLLFSAIFILAAIGTFIWIVYILLALDH